MIQNIIGLKNHVGFMRYFKNTSWMMGEQMLRMMAGLLVGVWVARYLGPEQFGIFSYALAFTSIFSVIAKLGLDGIVVRDLINEPEKRNIYLGTAFWLKLIGAFITLGIVALATLFASNENTTNHYIFIIASGIIFQSFEVVDFYFQSQVLSKYVSLCKMTQLFLSSLLKLYLIYATADLYWFVLVSLIDQMILAFSLYIAYRCQKLGGFYTQFERATAKKLLKNSWPLIVAAVVLMIQARIDQVMLKHVIGNTELGYYSSALRLIEVFSFIPIILTTSLFPAIINAKKVSLDVYRERLFNLYRLMMLLFIIVALPIFLFGNKIIIFIYKDAYAPAGQLFSIMALRLFFTNYGVVRSAFLTAENLMQFSMVTMVFGMLTNLVLNYYWIPNYHSIGAIWASLVSFSITTFLIDFLYYKTRRNCNIMIKSMFLVKI